MAIAFNAASSAFGTGTTASVSHTAAGSDRAVVIGIINDGDVPSAISYGAQTPTLISSEGRLHLYQLLAPSTGAQTVSATIASANWVIGVVSYTGVDSFGTFQEATSSETTSVTTPAITSSATGLIVDVAYMVALTMSPGGGQTVRVDVPEATHQLGFFAFGMSEKAGAASTTMSWSTGGASDDNYIIAIPMVAAAGGGGESPKRMLLLGVG